MVGKRGLLKAVGTRRREEERAERERARRGVNGFVGRGGRGGGRGGERLQRGDAQLARGLEASGVIIDRAPTGMQRRVENSTSWNKAQKCVAWQVEWMRMNEEGKVERVLGKVLDNRLVSRAFSEVLEEERLAALSEVERRAEKKRKAEVGARERARWKRARVEGGGMGLETRALMQDSRSGAWCVDVAASQPASQSDVDTVAVGSSEDDGSMGKGIPTLSPDYSFYLLRPHTSSSKPRVLIPLSPAATLADCLRNRVVLEYPTLYVLRHAPTALPEGFMTEEQYLAGAKRGAGGLVSYDSGSEDEDDDEDEGEEEEAESGSGSGSGGSGGSDSSSSEEESEDDGVKEEEDGDAMEGVEGAEANSASTSSSSGEEDD